MQSFRVSRHDYSTVCKSCITRKRKGSAMAKKKQAQEKKQTEETAEKDRLVEFPEVCVGYGSHWGKRCKRFKTKTGKGLSDAVSLLPCVFEDGSMLEVGRNLVKLDPDGSLEKKMIENKLSKVQFMELLWKELEAGMYNSEIPRLGAKHGISSRDVKEMMGNLLKKKKVIRVSSEACHLKGMFYMRQPNEKKESEKREDV